MTILKISEFDKYQTKKFGFSSESSGVVKGSISALIIHNPGEVPWDSCERLHLSATNA